MGQHVGRVVRALSREDPDLVRAVIEDVLKRNKGNRRASAAELGVSPPTFYSLAEELGIELEKKERFQISRSDLIALLLKSRGNRAQVGRELGVARETIARLCKAYSVDALVPGSNDPYWSNFEQ